MGSICGRGEKPDTRQSLLLPPVKKGAAGSERLSLRLAKQKEEEEVIDKDTVNALDCTLANLVKLSRKIFDKLDVAQGADLVILIGNTGCGKSTLLSSLIFGPEKLHETQVEVEVVTNGRVETKKRTVIEMKDSSGSLSLFKIGHSRDTSETFIPHFYQDKKRPNLIYSDVAGLLDSGSLNMRLLNCFILMYIFQIAASVRFVMPLTYNQIQEARGYAVREHFDSVKRMCEENFDTMLASILPVVTKANPKDDEIDIDAIRATVQEQLQCEVNVQRKSMASMKPELQASTQRFKEMADFTTDDEDPFDDAGLVDGTDAYFKQLERFYSKLSAKMEIVDPLDRVIPEDNDEEDNQAIPVATLLERILSLTPANCDNFNYPMNEELHLKLQEKLLEAKDAVCNICQYHIDKAKEFGSRYDKQIEDDPAYDKILADLLFIDEYKLVRNADEGLAEVKNIVHKQTKLLEEAKKYDREFSDLQKKAFDMILKCRRDNTKKEFKALAEDMVLQSQYLQGIKENEGTDSMFKKDFIALIEQNIEEVVVDLFSNDREGFFKFAFFLRKLDEDNLYTEAVLTNETIPSILVNIIRSNYWDVIDEKRGTMRVDPAFHVQFRLAGDFVLQYPTETRRGVNVWPFLKSGPLLHQHTDKFQVHISQRGLVVKSIEGQALSEVARVDGPMGSQASGALYDYGQVRFDMTFFQLSNMQGAYWNFGQGNKKPLTKNQNTFYLEQVLYDSQGRRTGRNLRPARLISKDKLFRKPSRIMSTGRDFRGYDQDDQAYWTIEQVETKAFTFSKRLSLGQIRS